jgi:hypothetical protein
VDGAGTLQNGGNTFSAAYRVGAGSATERPSRLWMFRLPKPLSQYTF